MRASPLSFAASTAPALFATVLMVVGSSTHAAADQENLPTRLGLNIQSAFLNWQQEVQAGQAGLLTQVDLFLEGEAAPQSFQFYLNRGVGWQSDANDFETLVNVAPGMVSIDVSAAGLMLLPGDKFVIGVVGRGPQDECCNLRGTVDNSYAPGQLWESATAAEASYDMGFRTWLQAVPEPGTYGLMALGMAAVGLAGSRRRARA